jgi:hypothetical protein
MLNDIIPGANNRYLNVWSEFVTSGFDIYANLDHEILGVEENREYEEISADHFLTTIISGPLQLPQGKAIKVYAVTGQEVDSRDLAPGTYFIEIEGEISGKVVKIK